MDFKNLNINEIEQLRGLLSLTQQMSGANVTLGKFVDEYLEYIKQNRSSSYYKSHQLSFNHLVEYFESQRMISSISFRDAEMFITHLQQMVNKGYRVYYRNLKASFNKAVDWKYIVENPFINVKLPKQQLNKPEFIDEVELKKITEKIDIKVVRDVAEFSFYTGCRLGEIVNLRWKNVNMAESYVVIGDDEFETKGRNQRTIPLCNEAVKVLAGRLGKVVNINGYVFNKRGGKVYSGDFLSKRFKRGCRLAGVSEKIHFHSLRHSFASNLVLRDVQIYKVKKLMGHSSITTTEIYAHLNLDGLRDAVSVFN